MKSIFKYMLGTFVGVICGLFASIFLLAIVFGSLVMSTTKVESQAGPTLKTDSILVLDLSREMKETSSDHLFGGPIEYSLHELHEAINKAKKDEKVKSIFVKMSGFVPVGWSTAKEMRNLLESFKESKKQVFAYGEFVDEKALYIASVADKIHMHPTGEIRWDGFAAVPTFYKGTFEKLKVEPVVFRAGKFKSAIEPFTRKSMSQENRQQLEELLEDLWEETVEGFADARNIDSKEVRDFAESSEIRTAKQALKVNFIDELSLYSDVVEGILRGEDKEKEIKKEDFKRFISVGNYLSLGGSSLFMSLGKKGGLFKGEEKSDDDKIAVVVLEGGIVSGRSEDDSVGSETVLYHLRKARLDSNIKGVVLRINSPGGSALASDVIWHEVKKLNQVKPVFASMGDVAASGGYYVAVGAEKIYAEENTITGSIGVFSLLFNLRGVSEEKLGLTFDRVVTNPYADLGSSVRQMNEGEKDIFRSDVKRIYSNFLNVVQQGRRFEKASDVEDLAQGRVWSGSQAKEVGLVDEIGGISKTADDLAARLELEDYELVFLPKRKTLDMLFSDLFSVSAQLKKVSRDPLSYMNELRGRLEKEGPLLYFPYKLQIN